MSAISDISDEVCRMDGTTGPPQGDEEGTHERVVHKGCGEIFRFGLA